MEDVCDRLTEHGYLDARNLEVQVADGVVALDGTVNDQYSRRIAQDLAEAVSGVVQVQNNLRVNYAFADPAAAPVTTVT
jgi:osmotically-inducible protein OsmY